MILRHATGDVRMVMLYAYLPSDAGGKRHPRAHITRVQIVGRRSWRNLEQVLHLGQRFLEKPHGLVVFKVSDVLAQDRVAVFRQADGILQLAPKRQYLFHLNCQIDGLGHKAARAA